MFDHLNEAMAADLLACATFSQRLTALRFALASKDVADLVSVYTSMCDHKWAEMVDVGLLADFFNTARSEWVFPLYRRSVGLSLSKSMVRDVYDLLHPSLGLWFLPACGYNGALVAVDLVDESKIRPDLFYGLDPLPGFFIEPYAQAMLMRTRLRYVDLPPGWLLSSYSHTYTGLLLVETFDDNKQFTKAIQVLSHVPSSDLTSNDVYDIVCHVYGVCDHAQREDELFSRLLLWLVLMFDFTSTQKQTLFNWIVPGSLVGFHEQVYDLMVAHGVGGEKFYQQLVELVASSPPVLSGSDFTSLPQHVSSFFALQFLSYSASLGEGSAKSFEAMFASMLSVDDFVEFVKMVPDQRDRQLRFNAFFQHVKFAYRGVILSHFDGDVVDDAVWKEQILSSYRRTDFWFYVPLSIVRGYDFSKVKPLSRGSRRAVSAFHDALGMAQRLLDDVQWELFVSLYKTYDGSLYQLSQSVLMSTRD